MAQRKLGLSAAQERLARLAGQARPVSEQEGAPSPPEAAEPLEEATILTPTTLPAESDDTPVVTIHDALHVSTQDASPDTSHVSDDVTSHVSEHTPPRVASLVPQQVAPQPLTVEAVAVGSAKVTLSSPQLSARVRGRWTEEQRQFLRTLSKRHRATAGEILRHIVAWYLAEGHTLPAREEEVLPFGIPMPRERGLKILDFLTTPAQVQAIQKFVSHLEMGEAAMMRRAVDLYREHGPLVGTKG